VQAKWTAFIGHYLLALLVFNLAACSTMNPVSIEHAMKYPPGRGIDYGSLVHVKMLDKTSVKFRVAVMNADGLGTSSEFYRYEGMANLKVEGENTKSNAGMIILGILSAAALVFLVANADSVSVCSPTPCEVP
jgi:uncharacterized integral membrane protein